MAAILIFEEMKRTGETLGSAIGAGIVFEKWQWEMILKREKK